MAGSGIRHHGDARLPVRTGAVALDRPDDSAPHAFADTGAEDHVIWAFGNRSPDEAGHDPDQGVAFGEGLGANIPLAAALASDWTEARRPRSTPTTDSAPPTADGEAP